MYLHEFRFLDYWDFPSSFIFIINLSIDHSVKTRKAHKLSDWGRRCAGKIFLKANSANPRAVLVYQRLRCCTQRGEQLGFSWRVLSSSKQSKAHSWSQNAYQFKVLLHLPPFGHSLQSEFWYLQFWQVMVVLGGRDSHQSKVHPRLPIYLNTISWIPMSNYGHSIWPPSPSLRVRWT